MSFRAGDRSSSTGFPGIRIGGCGWAVGLTHRWESTAIGSDPGEETCAECYIPSSLRCDCGLLSRRAKTFLVAMLTGSYSDVVIARNTVLRVEQSQLTWLVMFCSYGPIAPSGAVDIEIHSHVHVLFYTCVSFLVLYPWVNA